MKSTSSIEQFLDELPKNQLLIVEELRAFIKERLPDARERLAYGVPFFYLSRRICFVWPTAIPRSGVQGDGVLFGLCEGHMIRYKAEEFRGRSNKVVRFVVYQSTDEIDFGDLSVWLDEAAELDRR